MQSGVSTTNLSKVKLDKMKSAITGKETYLKFHNDRTACFFPDVTFDVNDGEFCELLHEIDTIYKNMHSLNEVFKKYSKASKSKSAIIINNFISF